MLYIVNKKNPYFRNGAFIRKFDDGWEEAIMEQENGRARIAGYKGLIIPLCINMHMFALPVRGSYPILPHEVHRQRRLELS